MFRYKHTERHMIPQWHFLAPGDPKRKDQSKSRDQIFGQIQYFPTLRNTECIKYIKVSYLRINPSICLGCMVRIYPVLIYRDQDKIYVLIYAGKLRSRKWKKVIIYFAKIFTNFFLWLLTVTNFNV